MVVAWTGVGIWREVNECGVCFEDRVDMSVDCICAVREICVIGCYFFVFFSTTSA